MIHRLFTRHLATPGPPPRSLDLFLFQRLWLVLHLPFRLAPIHLPISMTHCRVSPLSVGDPNSRAQLFPSMYGSDLEQAGGWCRDLSYTAN